MSQLKNMYHTVVQDDFPDNVTMQFGNATLVYKRRSWNIGGEQKGLRYGENPDQPAALYELIEGTPEVGGVRYRGAGQGLVSALREEHMLQAGKHPGKTNLTDVDNGINILQYLAAKPAATIMKHNNPCGAAWSDAGLLDALDKAYWCDRIAAFGGAVIVNRPVNNAVAEFINASYFEVIAAPAYDADALETLKKRKNLRILLLPGLARLDTFAGTPFLDIKSLQDGGLVFQKSFVNSIRTADQFLPAVAEKDGTTIAARKPTAQEAEDLLFAWAVESGVTSNSVIFAKNGATVAIGTGEQDRVGCVKLAIHKAYGKYADTLSFKETGLPETDLRAKAATDPEAAAKLADIEARTNKAKGGLAGSAMVSDGFFPFRDGVDVALEQNVSAIAHPGGSLRDIDSIAAVNEASPQVAMVFTGQRSFKH